MMACRFYLKGKLMSMPKTKKGFEYSETIDFIGRGDPDIECRDHPPDPSAFGSGYANVMTI